MIKLNETSKFQLFCLENYKTTKGISGKEALNDFRTFQVFDFLSNHFEVLHTQGKTYIISDINQYIKNRE